MKDKSQSVKINLSDFFNCMYSSWIDYSYERTKCIGCEDYCRCTRIINAKAINFDLSLFIKKLVDVLNIKSDLDKYLLYKLIQFSYISVDDFEVNVCGGYYGEEVNGLLFNKQESLELAIDNLFKMSDVEKIKHILTLEYGYLLPILKNITKVSLLTVPLSSIKSRSDDENFYHKIKDTSEFYGKDYTLPRAVLFNNFLIDGNHRILEAKKLGLELVSVIILE